MSRVERFALVLATALISSLPGAVATQEAISAPPWYLALHYLARAAGIGVVAVVFGLLALVAARGRPDGGMRIALVITAVIGFLASWTVYYGSIRGGS